MRPIILYRDHDFSKEELVAARKYFFCTNISPQVQKDDMVIGRYSLWPYFKEIERNINYVGAKLLNNYQQHLYISDLQNYVQDLKELTPKTYTRIEDVPEEGKFILKGATNSKKQNWNKFMFANGKKEVIEVQGRLLEDSLISHQNIYIREYVPLFKYFDGLGGCPVSKEFRFFVCYGEIISGGYYWANYSEDLPEKPNISEVPQEFLQEVIKRIDNQSNFYCIDVAQKENGDWIVIELNDGMFSGLSDNDPEVLYKNLKLTIDKNNR